MARPESEPSASVDEELELLQELESNTPDEIVRQRAWSRVQIKARIVVQSANTSELRTFKVAGVTGDISAGGCQVLLPVPLNVGDAYRIEFDREALDLPTTFARCLRCRLIREDAFETGFSFFSPVELNELVVKGPRKDAA